MKKIKILGMRDLRTDDVLHAQRDYGIFITASRISEEVQDDDDQAIIYKLKATHIDSIVDLRESKPVVFEKGQTSSQKLRWRVIEKLGDSEYDNFMSWLLSKSDGLTEEYIESLKNN